MKTTHSPMLKEDERHTRGYLPANFYSMLIEGREQILHTHWHDEWEFFCVSAGQLNFQLNDAQFLLQAGEMAIVPAGQVHAGFAVDHGPCTFNALVFHPNLLAAPEYDVAFQRNIAPLIDGTVELPQKLTPGEPWQTEAIGSILSSIELLQTQPAAYELLIKSALFKVFALLVSHCRKPSSECVSEEYLSYRAERMRAIYDHIHRNCSKKLTVEGIARVANMSSGYLCRFFKDMTGRTITEYINHYRVAQAALLIESTDKKLLEIAMDTGFHNLSYFVGQFKRYMGATPSEFRRAQREHRAGARQHSPE